MSVAVAVTRTVHSLRSTICLLTQISSTRADFILPISSLQLQRTYSNYTAELHWYSRCLPFILCTNHEFPMESARLELMQAPHIIHCYGCVHFLLVTCIHLLPSVPHFLHVVYHFFIVLRVNSICCPPFSLLVHRFCTSTYCSQVLSRHCTA